MPWPDLKRSRMAMLQRTSVIERCNGALHAPSLVYKMQRSVHRIHIESV